MNYRCPSCFNFFNMALLGKTMGEVDLDKAYYAMIECPSCHKSVSMPGSLLTQRYAELRAEAVARGLSLLSAEEILQEVARRRGRLIFREDAP